MIELVFYELMTWLTTAHFTEVGSWTRLSLNHRMID